MGSLTGRFTRCSGAIMKKFFSILCLAVLVAGCDESTPEQIAKNNTFNLAHPQVIGEIDGQPLECVIIEGTNYSYPHYVYFVGNSVSENHVQQVGKVFYHRVTVFIDGKTNTFEGTNFQIQ